jgi:transposase, IS6 family
MRENRTCSLSGGRRPAPASLGAPPPTRLRVADEWIYLYRAVDANGQTIDFLLSPQRDAEAARQFFRQALSDFRHLPPREIVTDGNPTYPAIVQS